MNDQSNGHHHKGATPPPSLKPIVRAFYLIFVVLPYDENESSLRKRVSLALDISVSAFLLYLLCTDLLIVSRQWSASSPYGLILSALSGDLCSLLIRLVLMGKRSLISRAIRRMQVTQDGHDARDISLLFLSAWTVPALFFYKALTLTEEGARVSQANLFHGHSIGGTVGVLVALLVNVLVNQQLYAVPMYSVALCFYAYGVLSSYVRALERRVVVGADEHRRLYETYVGVVRRISRRKAEVEEALSLLLFLVYSYLISVIFIIISLLGKVWVVAPPSACLLLSLFLAAFYALSLRAAGVHAAASRLSRALHRALAATLTPSSSQEEGFLLLSAAEGQQQVSVTAGGLLPLEPSFVLQVTGAMISYGTFVAQLGGNVLQTTSSAR